MKERISKSVILVVIVGIALAGFILRQVLTRNAQTNSSENPVGSEDGRIVASNGAATRGSAKGLKQATILSDVVPLPLSAILVEGENEMWTSDKDFSSMPRGTQSFGGIEFHFEGLVQMQGTESEASRLKYRNRVLLPLAQVGVTNARIGSLHLIGATRYLSELEAEVAEVVWRYSDGTKGRSQLTYNEHIRDWNHVPYEEPAHVPYAFTKAIWRAEKPDGAGRWPRLYRVSLGNPEPDKPVRNIELTSGRGGASLFLVAATLDPLAPGVRSDDSPDLEPNDSIPPHYIDVLVTSAEDQAVPKANVKVQWRVKNERGIAATKRVSTDDSGGVRIAYPAENLSTLEITASHENFASRKMVWKLDAGDIVPSSYLFKLTAGVSIGGYVVDTSDAPVPDVKLSFHRFWTGGEDMNRKGEQAEFSTRTITTEAQGGWQLKDLPADLLANISLSVVHPDFLQTNLTLGRSGADEKKLREGIFKIVLSRGVELRGIVVDENSNPIADATVWTGRRFFPDRHQTNSDSAGQFVFQGVGEGDTMVSAMAKGRKPTNKTIKVRAGMDAVRLKLEPGGVIKGIVQNSAGEPIPDVQISLQNNGPGQREYEFSTTSGSDGRFTWDGAPDDEWVFFDFAKSGYAHKRAVRLKLSEENVVVLHKPREVQGVVLDADTSQPVTTFKVAAGRSYEPGWFYAEYNAKREIVDANGQFTLTLDDEQQNGIQVRADDYADQIKEAPNDQEGVIKMEFKMKPSAALHGIVVGPDGSPVQDAQVALTKAGLGGPQSVYWRGGKLENQGGGAQIVTTDSSGSFTLNSPPESDGLIVALGEIGFGSTTVQEVRSSGIVMLQPFGQIEGVLKIAGQPASGREILFSLSNVGMSTDFQKFKVETDDEGKFKFEKLPPGEGELVRLVKTTPNSWMHSQTTSVNVEPGQTTFVTLGESGAVIRGRARLESPPEDGESLTISGSLNIVMENRNFGSPAETQAFYRSAEWRAKHFAVLVNSDGTFTVDSVPPGSYSLTLSASRAGEFGPRPGLPRMTKSLNVTVSDNPDPMAPIDVGEVVLAIRKPQP